MSRNSLIGNLHTQSSGLADRLMQDCSTLQSTTQIISPSMIHFSKTSLGERLNVMLDGEIIVLLNSSGSVVGSINPAWITNLIYCIKKGNNYQAIVSNLTASSIDVTIQSV